MNLLNGDGFTLIEVLIALLVFSIAGFAVTSRVGDVVNQTFAIERRTVAHWVAENHLNRLEIERRAGEEPLPSGRRQERVLMGGREWRIEVDYQDTGVPTFRRLELDVYEVIEGDLVGPLDHMTAFLGEH